MHGMGWRGFPFLARPSQAARQAPACMEVTPRGLGRVATDGYICTEHLYRHLWWLGDRKVIVVLHTMF